MNRKKDSFLQKMRHEVMPNAKGYMSNQGENQRASVAREEERGVAADTQIIPPQIRLLDLQEKVFQQERELDRLRGERDSLRNEINQLRTAIYYAGVGKQVEFHLPKPQTEHE